ncbi:hypothetical protein EDD92_0461 [Streptomyces sp. TLI_185]|nr:hypothetical protein EDD92_0461 [Streptomyces sp. TLI_185]
MDPPKARAAGSAADPRGTRGVPGAASPIVTLGCQDREGALRQAVGEMHAAMDGLHRQLPDSVLGEPEEASAYGILLLQAQRLAETLRRRHGRRLPRARLKRAPRPARTSAGGAARASRPVLPAAAGRHAVLCRGPGNSSGTTSRPGHCAAMVRISPAARGRMKPTGTPVTGSRPRPRNARGSPRRWRPRQKASLSTTFPRRCAAPAWHFCPSAARPCRSRAVRRCVPPGVPATRRRPGWRRRSARSGTALACPRSNAPPPCRRTTSPRRRTPARLRPRGRRAGCARDVLASLTPCPASAGSSDGRRWARAPSRIERCSESRGNACCIRACEVNTGAGSVPSCCSQTSRVTVPGAWSPVGTPAGYQHLVADRGIQFRLVGVALDHGPQGQLQSLSAGHGRRPQRGHDHDGGCHRHDAAHHRRPPPHHRGIVSAVVTGPDGPHALRRPTRFLMHVSHSLVPDGRAGSLRGGSHARVHGCSVPVVRGRGTGSEVTKPASWEARWTQAGARPAGCSRRRSRC